LFALQVAKSCFVPALLGHAIEDDFIRPHHSDRILEAYKVNMFARIWVKYVLVGQFLLVALLFPLSLSFMKICYV